MISDAAGVLQFYTNGGGRQPAAGQSTGYETNIGCTVADINSLLRGRHGLASLYWYEPDELRGRVMSIFGLAFRGGLPVGSLIAGVLVRRAGVPAVMAVSSALLLVVAVWLLLRHRDLRAL